MQKPRHHDAERALRNSETISPASCSNARVPSEGCFMRWPIAIFLLCAWAAAQQPTEVHESYPTSTRAESAITVPAGTQIPLKLSQGISTKSAKVGDPV